MRALLLAVFICALPPALALGQDDFWRDLSGSEEPALRGGVHQRAEQILGPRYQTDLPEIKVVEIEPIPAGAMPDFFVQATLILGGIILVMLIFNFVYSSRAFAGDDQEEGGDGEGEIDFSRLQLPDPDDLAGRGLYADAIHALLLRALVVVARRTALRWPRSLTSREILRHPQLPAGVRGPLQQLVQRVETHHFGGIAPAEADFARCREIFTRLDRALPGGKS